MFRRAVRVIKPGDRLVVSAIINIVALSAEMQADPALLCGCVAGAASAERIEGWFAGAGSTDMRITPKPESRGPVGSCAPRRNLEEHTVSANRNPQT